MTRKILLASSNPGKLREFAAGLAEQDIELVPQSAFGVTSATESGLTFVENAILKARQASRATGLPTIADDSGLEVDALGGAPGVFSARYAGPEADDSANNARLLRELSGIPSEQRTARFRCVLVYLRNPEDSSPIIGQGVWEGRILCTAQGQGGFGYDPLFFVPERNCSAAELPVPEKNRLSHRGAALQDLLQQWRT